MLKETTPRIVTSGDFVRLAKSLASANDSRNALQFAVEHRASERVLAVLKAASPAHGMDDPVWSGSNAPYSEMSRDFIAAVAPASIFYTLAALAVPAPMRARWIATAMVPADDHTEGEWLPVNRAVFSEGVITPKFTGAIVVVTQALIAARDEEAFAILKDALEKGAVAAVDRAFWGSASDSVVPVAASDTPMADLYQLLSVVNTSGAARLIFAVAPDAANAAAAALDGVGASMFPAMTPTGGFMIGVPAVVSDAVPTGSIALLDASGFSMNAGSVAVDKSQMAALQMKTDPAQTKSELVSMFQTNSVAIRVVQQYAAERRRDTATAILSGVPAGWAVGAAS